MHVLLGPIQHANRSNLGYMVNSTVIVGDRGVILVDPGGTDEVGRHVGAAVRRITALPVTHVVNTHHHGDHHLGNVAFAGATIISSQECRRLVEETGHEWVEEMRRATGRPLPGTHAVPATLTYPAGRTEVKLEGVRMTLWVPKGSHTAGDMVVHLPDERVLIAGDILVKGIVPTLQDGHLGNWIATLEEIGALGAGRFVPGHGDLMEAADVAALRDSLQRFRAGVKAGHAKGLTESEVRRSVDLSAWERLERAHVIGRNVNRAMLEAEADSFDAK